MDKSQLCQNSSQFSLARSQISPPLIVHTACNNIKLSLKKGWNTGYSKEQVAPVQVLHVAEEKTFQNERTFYMLHAQHLTQTVNYSSGADIWNPVRLLPFSNLWLKSLFFKNRDNSWRSHKNGFYHIRSRLHEPCTSKVAVNHEGTFMISTNTSTTKVD